MVKDLQVLFNPKQLIAYNYLCDNITEEVYFGGAAGVSKSWLGTTWIGLNCSRYNEVRYLMARKEMKKTKETTIKCTPDF